MGYETWVTQFLRNGSIWRSFLSPAGTWTRSTYLHGFLIVISEIRHPEELSLCKPVAEEHLKFNYGEYRIQEEKKRRVTLGSMPSASHHTLHHQSALDISLPVVDRADTNTFVSNSGTLGRKISSNSWTNSPARFRSLGRNGTLDAHRRRSEHSAPHINVSLKDTQSSFIWLKFLS